jgi:hypothetical protein
MSRGPRSRKYAEASTLRASRGRSSDTSTNFSKPRLLVFWRQRLSDPYKGLIYPSLSVLDVHKQRTVVRWLSKVWEMSRRCDGSSNRFTDRGTSKERIVNTSLVLIGKLLRLFWLLWFHEQSHFNYGGVCPCLFICLVSDTFTVCVVLTSTGVSSEFRGEIRPVCVSDAAQSMLFYRTTSSPVCGTTSVGTG